MSNKELIKAGCVLGGLVGLGILAYMILKEDDEKVEKALSQPRGNPKWNKRSTKGKKNAVMKVNRDNEFKDIGQDQHNDFEDPLEQIDQCVEQLDELVANNEEVNQLPPPEADEFPLRPGSAGERVERLQVWLMRNYGLFGKITKTYDEKTDELVKKYLGMDIVDEKTFNQYKMGKHVVEQIIVR